MKEFYLDVWPEVNVSKYISMKCPWGKSPQKASITLYDEIQTRGITAGVLQNKMCTKNKTGSTVTASRISRHSSKKSHEAL